VFVEQAIGRLKQCGTASKHMRAKMAIQDENSGIGGGKQTSVFSCSSAGPVLEPFVDADGVAKFLAMKRKTILDWARRGIIPAHPFGNGKRLVWRFQLSEIASHAVPVQRTIEIGSPEIARLERKHG